MTEVNTTLADGHFCKGGTLIPTLQFRSKLAHDMMENNIGMDDVDYGRSIGSTCTPSIVACTLIKVKKHEGSYNRKAKKIKTSSRNIKNRVVRTLKLSTNGLEVFLNAPCASFCAMDVLSKINLRLLIMHTYCNKSVT